MQRRIDKDRGGETSLKINQDIRVGLNTNRKEPLQNNNQNNRFGDMVVKQGTKLQTEQLTRLLGDISTAGDRVARSVIYEN